MKDDGASRAATLKPIEVDPRVLLRLRLITRGPFRVFVDLIVARLMTGALCSVGIKADGEGGSHVQAVIAGEWVAVAFQVGRPAGSRNVQPLKKSNLRSVADALVPVSVSAKRYPRGHIHENKVWQWLAAALVGGFLFVGEDLPKVNGQKILLLTVRHGCLHIHYWHFLEGNHGAHQWWR